MTFNEAIEIALTRDSRYGREAYIFLREVLEQVMKRRQKSEQHVGVHVSVTELLECFRIQVLKEFGPMALTVLSYWGLHTAEDVGNIVFALVEAKFLTKTEEDTAEAFQKWLTFEEAFSHPFLPLQKK